MNPNASHYQDYWKQIMFHLKQLNKTTPWNIHNTDDSDNQRDADVRDEPKQKHEWLLALQSTLQVGRTRTPLGL